MGENLYLSTQTDRSGHLKPIFLWSEGAGGFLVAFNLTIVKPFRCDIHNIYHCTFHTSIITSKKPTRIRYCITYLSCSQFHQMLVEAARWTIIVTPRRVLYQPRSQGLSPSERPWERGWFYTRSSYDCTPVFFKSDHTMRYSL